MEKMFIIRFVGSPVGRPSGRLVGSLVGRLVVLFLLAFLMSDSVPVQAQEKPKQSSDLSAKKMREMEKRGLRPPSGPSFFIGPVEGSALFSLLLSDGNGASVSGSFTRYQVEVFEAVLQAAKDFALTDEAAGTGAPITTRLMDQHEWSLFVDVTKAGNQSRLYLSLVSISGRLTAQVGEITRGSKKEQSPLLFDILSRVREAGAGIQPQR